MRNESIVLVIVFVIYKYRLNNMKDGFSIFKKIYYISLPSAIDRRNNLNKVFKKNRITNAEQVIAYGPKDKIVEEAYESGRVKLWPPCFRCGQGECDCENNVLIPAQIANFLSHKLAWEKVAKSTSGFYLILEDDITTRWFAQKALKASVIPLLKDWDSKPLLLGLSRPKPKTKDNLLALRGKFSLIKQPIMSNYAYVMNPQMAQAVIDVFDNNPVPLNSTSDVFLHKNAIKDFDHYTLTPPIIHDLSWAVGKFASAIHPKQKYIKRLNIFSRHKYRQDRQDFRRHVSKAISRDILGIGHPRCGSFYLAEVLTASGIDTGHEETGERGIVSWMFSVHDFHNPYFRNKYGQSRYYVDFKHIIHFVRDPFAALPSIIRENRNSEPSYDFRKKHILNKYHIDLDDYANPLEKAAVSFLCWNRMIMDNESIDIVYRVENEVDVLTGKLSLLGYDLDVKSDLMPERQSHSKKSYLGKQIEKPIVSPTDWLLLPEKVKLELNQFCKQYAYSPIYNETTNELCRSE